MPKYISLLRFTEQGAKNIHKSTARAHDFAKAAEKKGVRVEGQYWTLGQYDGVLIIHADDESKALSVLADLSSQGNVRLETLRAFVDTEMNAITS